MNEAPANSDGGSPADFSDLFGENEDQAQHIDDVFGFSSKPDLENGASGEGDDDSALGAAEGEEEGGVKTPSSEPAKGKEKAPDPAPAADPNDRDLELESLRAQLEEAKKPKAEPEPKPAAGAEPPVDEPPAAPTKPDPIKIALPDQFKNAVFGDDPEAAGQAMDQLVSGIYTAFNEQMHNLVTGLPQIIEAAIEEKLKGAPQPGGGPNATSAEPAAAPDTAAQISTMRESYFKAFPNHNKPEIQPVLAQVAQEMAAQFPGAKFDEKYIASLGRRTTERLKKLQELMQPSEGRPPASLPAGSRSADPGLGEEDISDEIMTTLGR